jgi:hypothetical protein
MLNLETAAFWLGGGLMVLATIHRYERISMVLAGTRKKTFLDVVKWSIAFSIVILAMLNLFFLGYNYYRHIPAYTLPPASDPVPLFLAYSLNGLAVVAGLQFTLSISVFFTLMLITSIHNLKQQDFISPSLNDTNPNPMQSSSIKKRIIRKIIGLYFFMLAALSSVMIIITIMVIGSSAKHIKILSILNSVESAIGLMSLMLMDKFLYLVRLRKKETPIMKQGADKDFAMTDSVPIVTPNLETASNCNRIHNFESFSSYSKNMIGDGSSFQEAWSPDKNINNNHCNRDGIQSAEVPVFTYSKNLTGGSSFQEAWSPDKNIRNNHSSDVDFFSEIS